MLTPSFVTIIDFYSTKVNLVLERVAHSDLWSVMGIFLYIRTKKGLHKLYLASRLELIPHSLICSTIYT